MRQTKYYHTLLATLTLLVILGGCRRVYNDPQEEDYDKLFPFSGIEKPRISYEDQVRQICDPYEALEAYHYPGVEMPEGERRSYTVTVTCSFGEIGADPEDIRSRYFVRYIGEDKEIHTIASSMNVSGAEELMTVEEPYEVTVSAESGYPMYLSVNGSGPRGSSIKASIKAVSEDGLTVVKTLSVSQTQNKEGLDYINQPFCEYIILP